MTQQEIILNKLRETGRTGLNSYYATFSLKIKQAPTRISELKELGHSIVARNNPDRSVNWILLDSPKPVVSTVRPTYSEDDFIWTKDGRAIRKENVQEGFNL